MKKVLLILSICLFSVNVAFGMHGLSTKFSDVILSKMKPGMVYSLKQERNIPFTVINNADERKDVEVTIQIPTESQLKENYEPIPDITWVEVVPSEITLEPGEKVDCDIIISIPEDEKYEDRHFQAMIETKSKGLPDLRGISISFALASRIRFSTGQRPDVIIDEYRMRILDALEMEMTPMSMFIRDEIPVGEKVSLDGRDYLSPQVINRGREDYKLELKVAGDAKDYGLTTGYEPIPEDVEVSFKKKKMKIKGRSLNDVVMTVKIPDKEEYRGKQFAFVVIGRVTDFDVPIEVFSRVYFTTED